MWIISETKKKGEIASWDWIENWKEEHSVTLPVMRDFKFYQTYGAIKQHSTALPHLYVLDGNSMELVVADGGASKGSKAAEAKIFELLGVDPE